MGRAAAQRNAYLQLVGWYLLKRLQALGKAASLVLTASCSVVAEGKEEFAAQVGWNCGAVRAGSACVVHLLHFYKMKSCIKRQERTLFHITWFCFPRTKEYGFSWFVPLRIVHGVPSVLFSTSLGFHQENTSRSMAKEKLYLLIAIPEPKKMEGEEWALVDFASINVSHLLLSVREGWELQLLDVCSGYICWEDDLGVLILCIRTHR